MFGLMGMDVWEGQAREGLGGKSRSFVWDSMSNEVSRLCGWIGDKYRATG